MTLKKTTVPQLPVTDSINDSDHYILQQGSTTKRVSHETVVNTIEQRDLSPIELTYAAAQALVVASELVVGAKYLITDATTSDIRIILLAISTTKFSPVSYKTDDADNYYLYDFTNDVLRGKIGIETLFIGTSVPVGDPNFSRFEIQYNQIPGFSDTILYLNDQSIVVRTFDGIDARSTLERSRGTIDTPLPVQSGDVIGGFHISARNSLDAFESVFIIRTTATDVEESGFFPSQIVFYNRKKNGGHSILGDEFMRVDQNLILSVQGAFRSARLTTTERDALVGLIGGEQIFNTTTNKHQGYDGSAWNDMY